MKATLVGIALAAAILGLTRSAAHGQTWTAENVLFPSPGVPSTDFAPAGTGYAVLIDPFDSAPAPGILLGLNNSTVGNATIMRLTPTDSASSSFTVTDLDHGLSAAIRLANNPGDGLYAAGYAPVDPNAKNLTYVWKVRKSSSQGNAGTWTDDDTYFSTKTAFSTASGIATDSAGNIFVSGVVNYGSTPHWVVRRKTPGGAWSTVFDVKNNNVNMVPSVCFLPGDANNPPAIFTASDLNSKWTVMRSQNQGASGTWQQVDSWTGGGSAAAAYEVSCDGLSRTIYCVGCRGLNGSLTTPPSGWVIRASTDGGKTWSLLLDAPGQGSWAYSLTVDPSGAVSVSGVVNPGGNTPLWKVIRCAQPLDPASWSASFAATDTLPYGYQTYSKGRQVCTDAFGNVFAAGFVTDWTDISTSQAVAYSGVRVGLVRLVP